MNTRATVRAALTLTLGLGAAPGYAQLAALGLIEQGLGAATTFSSQAMSMAAQQQALRQQREALERQRAAPSSRPCPLGYHQTDALLADGTQAKVCIHN